MGQLTVRSRINRLNSLWVATVVFTVLSTYPVECFTLCPSSHLRPYHVISAHRNARYIQPNTYGHDDNRHTYSGHLLASTPSDSIIDEGSKKGGNIDLPNGGSTGNKSPSPGGRQPNLLEKIVASLSQSAATKIAKKYDQQIMPIWQSSFGLSALTLVRTLIPSMAAGLVAFVSFPGLALWLCSLFNDAGVFAVLSQDASQFVQNFLTVAGLLFSILVGQTYYFMYQQQEMVYYALFNEVTEAKSLLEQVALVSQGRSMYGRVLSAISSYVETDLKKLQSDPAVLLSSRPMDDPLETIMYLTSVGVPSTVYETVRSLRQARAQRLGALQRKLPTVHMVLLWILAVIELISFPLLGAGTQSIGGYKILTIEGCLFGVMTMGIVLTLRVVGELWRPAGGAYNVDRVLKVMVRGLEQELEARMKGRTITAQRNNFPTPDTRGSPSDVVEAISKDTFNGTTR